MSKKNETMTNKPKPAEGTSSIELETIGEERFLKVSEVAAIMGVSHQTIYNWSSHGPDRIPGFPVPRALGPKRTRFLRSEVLMFMKSAPTTADRALKNSQKAA